jgi:hypothetical protein
MQGTTIQNIAVNEMWQTKFTETKTMFDAIT